MTPLPHPLVVLTASFLFVGVAAVENSDTKAVKILLDCKKCDFRIKDLEGCTPLHVAALRGSLECCIALMEQGARISVADKEGKTPNDIWPVLEETQGRLVEGCFHSIALENLHDDKYFVSFQSLGSLVTNGENHKKVLEIFFLSNEGRDKFCHFLSTGSLNLMAEIFKIFEILLAGDQQLHFVKGTFVKIMLAALDNREAPQVTFAFGFLDKLFEKDDQGDLLRRLSSSPADVFLKLLEHENVPIVVSAASLLARTTRYCETPDLFFLLFNSPANSLSFSFSLLSDGGPEKRWYRAAGRAGHQTPKLQGSQRARNSLALPAIAVKYLGKRFALSPFILFVFITGCVMFNHNTHTFSGNSWGFGNNRNHGHAGRAHEPPAFWPADA